MSSEPNSFPQDLQADLFLLHAPSVYDFRQRDDVLFAYLSDSDSVNVTSIFEMYPLGFQVMKQHLKGYDFDVKIVNLASLMLMYPTLDVERLLKHLKAPVYGVDLHWLIHCHGAVEIVQKLKQIHPDALIIMGGISATYYADELMRDTAVDVIIKGYDTLLPLTRLMEKVRQGSRDFRQIPNLQLQDELGNIIDTGFTYKPTENYNDAAVDWEFFQGATAVATTNKLIMTLPNSGCAYDCSWCGGSRYTYRRLMGLERTLITKDIDNITREIRSLQGAAQNTTIYALQCYSETKERLFTYLDVVREMKVQSVSFEMYHLPDDETLQKMAASTQAYILLSPESHDREISRLAGRGNYSMAEMEAWIQRALAAGIAGVIIWFFIGMPRQTPQSVLDTVAYCRRLLNKFPKQQVIPLICPMVPFLDPGSRLYEEPHKHGYHIFYHTLAQHRQAVVEPLWYKRLNYESKWMSRRQLQDVTYQAIAQLVQIKAEYGTLPTSLCQTILGNISETTGLLAEIDHALSLDKALPADLRAAILNYNGRILATSSDQLIPMKRPFGGRWFDDFTVPQTMIEALT